MVIIVFINILYQLLCFKWTMESRLQKAHAGYTLVHTYIIWKVDLNFVKYRQNQNQACVVRFRLLLNVIPSLTNSICLSMFLILTSTTIQINSYVIFVCYLKFSSHVIYKSIHMLSKNQLICYLILISYVI